MNTLDLEQFISFAESGSLSAVAERFAISQPSVTRTMQRLEQELGVTLFTRMKNKIELNDVGRLAAEEADRVLAQLEQMRKSVAALDRQLKTISVASCEVYCIAEVVSQVRAAFPFMTIASEIKPTPPLLKGLDSGQYDLVILPFAPEEYQSKKIGEEHLMIALPPAHRLAAKKELTLAEMNGENMLLYSEIGFWKDVVTAHMPDSRFLVQSERYSFEELTRHSVLPYFTTEKAMADHTLPQDRTPVPVRDAAANPCFYLVCKQENKKRFRMLFAAGGAANR